MPSDAFTHLGAADMRALLAYLRSLPLAGPERPRPVMGAGARKEIADGIFLSAAEQVKIERDKEPWVGGPDL